MKQIICNIIWSTALLSFLGCTKILETELPKNQLTTEAVFSDSATAVAALTNIYHVLGNQVNSNFNKHVSLYTDEYAYYGVSSSDMEFFQSRLTPGNRANGQIWNNLYLVVYSCNQVIEEVEKNEKLSGNIKDLLTGEARALRAFAYLYLQMVYGSIPLLTDTDVNTNRTAKQSDSVTVFNQVLTDLTAARDLLPETYPLSEKVRVTKWAATSLLARLHLYQMRWEEAERYATDVISAGAYELSSSLDDVFVANSVEAILQFWNQNGVIDDAESMIPSSNSVIPLFSITDELLSAIDPEDKRKTSWIASNFVTTEEGVTEYHYPYKYRNRTAGGDRSEYLMAVRLAELYLIRAEARAQQGDLQGAIDDLNKLRKRAGIAIIEGEVAAKKCMEMIAQERRIELFGEWGHRFMDLKRTGKLQTTMALQKQSWAETASVFPIPQSELTYNVSLIQNNGY